MPIKQILRMAFLNLKEAGDLAKKDIAQAEKEVAKYDKAISGNQEQIQAIQKDIQDLADAINGKRARIQEINAATGELLQSKISVSALIEYYKAAE
jgi:chromosome segregation ATPase